MSHATRVLSKGIIPLALFGALFGGPLVEVRGDVVKLDNGNEIQGEIVHEDDQSITVRFPGGTLTLERRRVRGIEKESRLDYLLERGQAEILRQSYQQALESFRQAREVDPESERVAAGLIRAHHGYARELRRLGRFADARAETERIIAEHPESDEAQRLLKEIDDTVAEVKSEEQRGRRQILDGEVESGIWRLQKIYDDFPDRRDDVARDLARGLRLSGDRHYAKGDWSVAESRYLAAIAIRPELVEAVKRQLSNVITKKIEPLLRAGEFAQVATEARRGLDVAPENQTLRFYHGIGLEGQGKRRQAAEEYLAVSGAKRPSRLAADVGALRRDAEAKLLNSNAVSPTAPPEALVSETGAFRELRSKHFIAYHRNTAFAREVLQVAEHHYSRLSRALAGPTRLRAPIQIYVHANKEAYLEATGMEEWSGASHRSGKRLNVLTQHRIDCHQDQPRLLSGLLPHEIAHALFEHRLNYPKDLPLWVNEGFAVYCEPEYVHRHHTKILRQERQRRNLAPLADLFAATTYPETDVSLYYGQSFSITRFLVEQKGLATFINFAKSLDGSTKVLASTLRRVYGFPSITSLEQRWKATLE